MRTRSKADEEWRPVVGFDGFYEVSNFGRVRSLSRVIEKRMRQGVTETSFTGRVLQPFLTNGYHRVSLHANGKCRTKGVYIVVLEAFLGKRPHGCQASHRDGDRTNNSVWNLTWETPQENNRRKVIHGTAPRGERNHFSKLKGTDVAAIRHMLTSGAKGYEIAKEFGVTPTAISDIKLGRTWNHV